MRALIAAIIERHFSSLNGELIVGGVPVRTLAEHCGTPLFVYDRAAIDRQFARLRAALPPRFSIYYSVKANPNPVILRHFLNLGCGLEVGSGGEFSRARSVGCPSERVFFAGPGKTEAELELVLAEGIGEIHLESLREAERISTISRRLGVKARVAVRVNPAGEAEGGAVRMGGRPSAFGIDEEKLDTVLDRVLCDSTIEFCGVHLFTSTQVLNHEILLAQLQKGLELGLRAGQRIGRPLHTLDFGGGLGIPYFEHDKELDMDALRLGVADLMIEAETNPLFKDTGFVMEPGRYLIGESGIYIARINDIKISRGKKFLILDGGMNHHLAASGNLGQTIKRNFPLYILNRLDEPPKDTVDVVGPLCTPIDTLAHNLELPRAEVGDLIGIFQSGAYARTASPLEFLSHPPPPEVWVDRGQWQLIRGRGADCLRSANTPNLGV